MANRLLELQKVNVVFSKRGEFMKGDHKFHVLKDVDFHIDEGEIVAVVGESGCGKTTMGKVITGLQAPTSGKVIFQGVDITKAFSNKKEYRNAVQFIQQDSYAALNPVKTIYGSLSTAILAANKKVKRDEMEELMRGYLSDVGLKPAELYLYKYPHQLSGGQRQRILMARALALNPKIIVADEPVSMIDVSLRVSILSLMAKLNKEKKISFVYITHDLATARFIANQGRISVMYLGQIMEEGPVETLISSPEHPYTKALIAAVPIPDPKKSRNSKPIPIRNMKLMSLEHRKDCCPFYDRCPHFHDECLAGDIEYQQKGDVKIKCNLDLDNEGKE
ncbi:MAG: ABC transporter ATP-binding protein [Bacilli bacterium]|nr:ABC transporter ATP-binding protein [Bacilli bacterium]